MKLPLLFAGLLALPVVLMAEAPGVVSATSGDLAAAAAPASSSSASSGSAGENENAGRPARHPRLLASWRHRLREKFDADHGGRLTDAERDTAKATLQEAITTRRTERFQKLDADGDGQISRAEWDSAASSTVQRAGALRQRILNRFDADRDGQLSPAERAEARSALRRRLSH